MKKVNDGEHRNLKYAKLRVEMLVPEDKLIDIRGKLIKLNNEELIGEPIMLDEIEFVEYGSTKVKNLILMSKKMLEPGEVFYAKRVYNADESGDKQYLPVEPYWDTSTNKFYTKNMKRRQIINFNSDSVAEDFGGSFFIGLNEFLYEIYLVRKEKIGNDQFFQFIVGEKKGDNFILEFLDGNEVNMFDIFLEGHDVTLTWSPDERRTLIKDLEKFILTTTRKRDVMAIFKMLFRHLVIESTKGIADFSTKLLAWELDSLLQAIKKVVGNDDKKIYSAIAYTQHGIPLTTNAIPVYIKIYSLFGMLTDTEVDAFTSGHKDDELIKDIIKINFSFRNIPKPRKDDSSFLSNFMAVRDVLEKVIRGHYGNRIFGSDPLDEYLLGLVIDRFCKIKEFKSVLWSSYVLSMCDPTIELYPFSTEQAEIVKRLFLRGLNNIKGKEKLTLISIVRSRPMLFDKPLFENVPEEYSMLRATIMEEKLRSK